MSNPKLTDDCWWHEFGVHPDTGNIDIADREGDVAQNVPADQAKAIIKAHNDVINRIADRYVGGNKPERITIVEAPGDRCGGSKVLPGGELCPGCRACS